MKVVFLSNTSGRSMKLAKSYKKFRCSPKKLKNGKSGFLTKCLDYEIQPIEHESCIFIQSIWEKNETSKILKKMLVFTQKTEKWIIRISDLVFGLRNPTNRT